MFRMNVQITKTINGSYEAAERKAAQYFKTLHDQVNDKAYVPVLTKDFQSWKHNHIRHPILSFFSKRSGKPESKGYHHYIQWLDYTGKLDHYLDRSISYIFMRDLGKALYSPETKASIRKMVSQLKEHLTSKDGNQTDTFSMAGLYRWAKEQNIESTIIWLMDKLKTVSSNIPEGMDAEHGQRKLIKIIAGVIMHVMEEMTEEIASEERSKKLSDAIKLGYSYGLTYPFIDDLLDAKVLTETEKKQYSELIRTTLITGSVPKLGKWIGPNEELIRYIHGELREAYETIKMHQRPETLKTFFDQSYVFFQSQEVDRLKSISNPHYTNEELYIPVILKSSSSRLIVRTVLGSEEDEGFDNRTFYYGIYNQLADDFADMFDDLREGAVTPYTYYLTYYRKRKDLMNPFEMYWAVIANLIHQVYQSDQKTCEVILDRAINGLKRFKEKAGKAKYNEVMVLFSSGHQEFNKLIQLMVKRADDVDFFDKLLRDQMITNLRTNRREQDEFLETIEMVREQVDRSLLLIKKEPHAQMQEDPIFESANYALAGDGKRLRPIIAWFMGVNEYGLESSAILPLLKSLEYLHTASLIYDDLPSQDNAPIRRGRHTVHEVYNTAIAELTGLFLTQHAIREQATLEKFDSRAVLSLVHYSAQMTAEMCKGQAMDLQSKDKPLTMEQLNTMCFYKTGIAFEACLIMPAILADASDSDQQALKKFAYHAGIAFQIKDDLLDVEGNLERIGKTIGIDAKNNRSTFVSVLGVEGARKEMWEHYCKAMEVLEEMPRKSNFLKHLLDYFVNRDK
jgi:geranylgeranyl pyrophosphate synthase